MNAYFTAFNSVIEPVNCKYGAPMGRANIGSHPITVTSGPTCKIFKSNQTKVYTRRIRLVEGYDKGGAYWGWPDNLYCEFTADLTYVRYYRQS